MLMPSETEIVVNARGVPPAARTPRVSVRRLLGEIASTRRRLAGRRHHPDEGPRHRLVIEAHAAHEHAMRRAVDAVGGDARAEFGSVLAQIKSPPTPTQIV